MTTIFVIGSWMLISLSLFNGFSLVWLGLTMFLAAEKRGFGLWLVLIGMAMAGIFFLSHTVILADQLTMTTGVTAEVWWRIGWLPVIIAPLLWYMLILWYAGFWEDANNKIKWHLYTLGSLVVICFVLLLLHVVARPIPDFEQVAVLDFSNTLSWRGVPLMFILFPGYAITCVLLPFHALQHPSPSRRMMGDIARQRARPWLIGTSTMLLLVAVIVTLFILYVILPNPEARNVRESTIFVLPMVILDLGITGLIAVAIVSLGRAVVSYEIFTGKTLPRRGFSRQWTASLVFTGLVSLFIGYCLIFQTHLIYGLITLAGICIVAYALLSWRIFVYRDETFASLRPFVSGQSLLQDIIDPKQDVLSNAQTIFDAFCEGFLGITHAQLTPLNTASTLIGTSLVFPKNGKIYHLSSVDGTEIQQLDPTIHAGFRWQIPLWSGRGLIGYLLLGEKVDGGLFTEEEIQVVQTTGERLIDSLSGEQIARRLMAIQRNRMKEQRIMDFQTRRTLHDQTLPTIHTAILALSAIQEPATREVIQSLSEVHQQISRLIHNAPDISQQENHRFLEMIQIAIQNEFAGEFDYIHWKLPEHPVSVDRLSADVLFGAIREVVRNAAVHGRGNDPKRLLSLWIDVTSDDNLQVKIVDNGVGANNVSQIGGSGSGLSLHTTLLAVIGGSLIAEAKGAGFEVIINLPKHLF